MIGYKIHYGEYDHDCWGKPEWCGWFDYDNNVYTTKEKCNQSINEAKKKYPERQFKMYEIEIK